MTFRRSNALIDHAFGNRTPAIDEVWRARARERQVRVRFLSEDQVHVVATPSGRPSTIRLDVFIASYVPVDPPTV